MDNNKPEQGSFTYTYSAKEQAEIKKIRQKYTPPAKDEDKMTRLRRLDADVTKTARAIALVFGVIGTLILGGGMSICMTEFGEILGTPHEVTMVIGILIGIFGGILAGIAYPIYNAIVKAKRQKLAPEIIRLTDELMK